MIQRGGSSIAVGTSYSVRPKVIVEGKKMLQYFDGFKPISNSYFLCGLPVKTSLLRLPMTFDQKEKY